MSYKFKKTLKEQIRIYCGVSFKEKENAKSFGFKWDIENKAWYMVYDYELYCNNKSLNTLNYEPFRVSLVNFNTDKMTIPTHTLINNLYREAFDRWDKYVFELELQNENKL